MTSREKIKSIKSLINEFYHNEKCEGRLTECANDCWKSYQKYCDEIEQDLDRLEHLEKENQELIVNKNVAQNIAKKQKVEIDKLEKELKQTKLNFRNSQIHSKNCYKKLKEKYNEVKYCYEKLSKDHMSLKKSFDELFEVYIRVKRELEQLEKENQGVKDDNTRLWHSLECANNENAKLKQAIKILKEHFELFYNKCTDTYEIKADLPLSAIISKATYELLEEIFENEGEE